jgi:uncharacterized repeat protein (TIGR02543 family)
VREAYLGIYGSGTYALQWNDFQQSSTSVKGFVMETPLQKITITAKPQKTTYSVGEALSLTGMAVSATYGDGSTRTVTGECAVSGFDPQAGGTQTVTVSYGGKTDTFQVTVGAIITEGYTIYFDPNGGTVSPTSQKVEYGKAVGTMPTPTRQGYSFYCWYIEQDGTRYMIESTTKYNIQKDSTFTAYWVKETVAEDKPSEWAKGEVETAIALGLVPTDLQKKYTTDITRAEFCRLIVNMLEKMSGRTIEDTLEEAGLTIDQDAFTDTKDQDILAAYALGIIKGIGNRKFDPAGKITREAAATMLMRAYYGPDIDEADAVTPVNYADRSKIGIWARNGVDLASTMKDPASGKAVMQGDGNRFKPQETYTREQAYLTILRLYRCLAEG